MKSIPEQRLAAAISHLLSPAGVAALAMLLLSAGRYDDSWLLLTLAMYTGTPVTILLLMLWRQRQVSGVPGAIHTDVYDPSPRRRQGMLAVGVILYGLCLASLWSLGAPPVYLWAGATFLAGAAAVWAINFAWKISIHATGAGGVAAILALAAVPGWPLGAGLPLVVAWARRVRGAHSIWQLIAGSLVGAASAVICRELFG